MTCKDAQNKISAFLDNELTTAQEETLKSHLETCKACKTLYDDMVFMKEMMADLPQLDLPDGFSDELHMKLEDATHDMQNKTIESDSDKATETQTEEQSQKHKGRNYSERKVIQIPLPSFKDFKRHSKGLTAVAATLLVAVLVYGAGNVGNRNQNMEEASYDMATESTMEVAPQVEPRMAMSAKMADDIEFNEMENAEEVGGAALNATAAFGTDNGDGSAAVQTASEGRADSATEGRMIIYSADVYLDIVNYDETYNQIVSRIEAMGGYIEDASTSYKFYDEADPENSLKYGRLTVRLPREQFTGTVDYLATVGVQKNLNIWSQDITAQYRDISNEVANLEIREKKLREIMDKAEAIEDIISVERELSRVRGEINNYMGTLKNWESLVNMSTVHIDLNEVESLEPKIRPIDRTLLQKAKDGFIQSINQLKYIGETFFIVTVGFFPKLIVWGIVFFIGYKIVRWLLKKYRK
jgi:hypothetical protein